MTATMTEQRAEAITLTIDDERKLHRTIEGHRAELRTMALGNLQDSPRAVVLREEIDAYNAALEVSHAARHAQERAARREDEAAAAMRAAQQQESERESQAALAFLAPALAENIGPVSKADIIARAAQVGIGAVALAEAARELAVVEVAQFIGGRKGGARAWTTLKGVTPAGFYRIGAPTA